jgi:hypothetical protein
MQLYVEGPTFHGRERDGIASYRIDGGVEFRVISGFSPMV